MINIAEVEAACDAAAAKVANVLERQDEHGVVARCQVKVNRAITLWRAEELNRDTDVNTIWNALVALIAVTIAGEVSSVTDDVDVQFSCVNKFLRGVAEEVGRNLARKLDIDIPNHEGGGHA